MLGVEDIIDKVTPHGWRLIRRRTLAFNRVLVYERCSDKMWVEIALVHAGASRVILMVSSFPNRLPTQDEVQCLIPILLKTDLPITGIEWIAPGGGLFANPYQLRTRLTLRP